MKRRPWIIVMLCAGIATACTLHTSGTSELGIPDAGTDAVLGSDGGCGYPDGGGYPDAGCFFCPPDGGGYPDAGASDGGSVFPDAANYPDAGPYYPDAHVFP